MIFGSLGYLIAALTLGALGLYLSYRSLAKLKSIKYSSLFLVSKIKTSRVNQTNKFVPSKRIILEIIIISLLAFLLGKPEKFSKNPNSAVVLDNYFSTAAYYGDERWIEQGKRLLKRYMTEDIYISTPKLQKISYVSIDNIKFEYQDSNLISSLNELSQKGYSSISVISPDTIVGDNYITQDLKPDQKNLTRNLAITDVSLVDQTYQVTIRSFSDVDTSFNLNIAPTNKKIAAIVNTNSSTILTFDSNEKNLILTLDVEPSLDIIREDSNYNLKEVVSNKIYVSPEIDLESLKSIKSYDFLPLSEANLNEENVVIGSKKGNFKNQLVIAPGSEVISGTPNINTDSPILRHLTPYSLTLNKIKSLDNTENIYKDLEIDNKLVLGHTDFPEKIIYSSLELIPFQGNKNLFNSIIFLNSLNYLTKDKKNLSKDYFYSERSSNLQQEYSIAAPKLEATNDNEFDWTPYIFALLLLLTIDYLAVSIIYRDKNV